MPKELTYNESISTNEQVTANLFYDYFSSVYSSKLTVFDTSKLNTYTFNLSNNAAFSVDDIFNKLVTLNGVWLIGPVGLSGHFLF